MNCSVGSPWWSPPQRAQFLKRLEKFADLCAKDQRTALRLLDVLRAAGLSVRPGVRAS